MIRVSLTRVSGSLTMVWGPVWQNLPIWLAIPGAHGREDIGTNCHPHQITNRLDQLPMIPWQKNPVNAPTVFVLQIVEPPSGEPRRKCSVRRTAASAESPLSRLHFPEPYGGPIYGTTNSYPFLVWRYLVFVLSFW